MTRPTTVLIAEDDPKLGPMLVEFLRAQGFEVSLRADGAAVVAQVLADPPDLVLLDVMMPGEDGLSICRRLRSSFEGAILLLTALRSDHDQIRGLGVGADDYIVKPVDPHVLVARMASVLRRTRPQPPEPARCVVGELILDRTRLQAWWRGLEVLHLTPAEFQILWRLVLRAGHVVSRDELFEAIGSRYDGLDRGIDIHLSRIRRKLGEVGFPRDQVRAVRGEGYLLVTP